MNVPPLVTIDASDTTNLVLRVTSRTMPRAFDTSPGAAAVHVQLYRDVGEAKRAEIMAELSDALRDLAVTGVRHRHPEFDDEQVRKEVLAVFYSRGRMSL
jgi:hypothetical protein